MAGTAFFGQWPQTSNIVGAALIAGNSPPVIVHQEGLNVVTSCTRTSSGLYVVGIDNVKTGPLALLNILLTAQTPVLNPDLCGNASVTALDQITVLWQQVTDGAAVDAVFWLQLTKR